MGAWVIPLDWRLRSFLMCIVGMCIVGAAARYKILVCEKDETIREKDETIRENDKTIRALEFKISALTSNKIINVPDLVLVYEVFTYLRFKDYCRTNCANHHLRKLVSEESFEKKLVPLRVPGDCKTLKEAVQRVHENGRLTTIVLGEGEHVVEVYKIFDENDNEIDDNTLVISSAMNIVGDPGVPKEKIVVLGGIHFKKRIQGNCHLQHLTLRQAKLHGVVGESSFTMEEVLVGQCGIHGVWAAGTGVVGRCTNVEVRQCGCEWSGCILWWFRHIDRCQDDGAPQLYQRRE